MADTHGIKEFLFGLRLKGVERKNKREKNVCM